MEFRFTTVFVFKLAIGIPFGNYKYKICTDVLSFIN